MKPLVLVDALNVARSRWPNLRPELLVRLTERWAASEGVETVIVFDGQAPDERPDGTVVGTGAGSADDWIAEQARRLAGDGRLLWIVTSDRELRERVRPYVEHVIGGGAFAGLLESSGPTSG